ncbi:MAG: translation initiation factor IF-2 N-terminal domain-containing protein, partial [Rubrivivax sp.]
MAVTTVAQFAAQLNRPTAALIEQLQSAGVAKKSPDDALTDNDKERLLEFLRSSHGTASADRKKIVLTRKSTSEIKQADASGKARTIQVEVRKKRTFVKREDTPVAAEEAAAPVAPVIDEAEQARREAEAAAQAALIQRQMEDAAERQRQAEAAAQAQREREAAEAAAAEAAARAAEEAARAAAAAAAAASGQAGEAGAAGAAAAAPAEAKAEVKAEAKVEGKAEVKAEVKAEAKAEAPRPGLRVVKAADADASARQAAAESDARRRKAESEAAAIREMMSRPKGVLTAKKPEEAKPAEGAGIKGTIHKPAAKPGAPAAAPSAAKPGDKKQVKSEKLSSSWADDAAKKRALKTRGDTGGASRAGWRAPRGSRRGDRDDGASGGFAAPAAAQVQEVHVPETISVADLAHKMSVKGSEVIKQLMKLGQMVTINQQ